MPTPEEREELRREDQSVLDALSAAGSDLSKPHRVEHFFVCRDLTNAKSARAWAIADGHKLTPLEEHRREGAHFWTFKLLKSVVPTIETVTAETDHWLAFAQEHGIEYDGWECPVEAESA